MATLKGKDVINYIRTHIEGKETETDTDLEQIAHAVFGKNYTPENVITVKNYIETFRLIKRGTLGAMTMNAAKHKLEKIDGTVDEMKDAVHAKTGIKINEDNYFEETWSEKNIDEFLTGGLPAIRASIIEYAGNILEPIKSLKKEKSKNNSKTFFDLLIGNDEIKKIVLSEIESTFILKDEGYKLTSNYPLLAFFMALKELKVIEDSIPISLLTTLFNNQFKTSIKRLKADNSKKTEPAKKDYILYFKREYPNYFK